MTALLSRIALARHAAAAVSYSSLMLPLGAAAWWRMGDASGPVLDSSGNGRNATIVGAPTRAVTGLVDGDADAAMGFNGGLNYATIADAAWMDSATISLVGVVKPATLTGTPYIMMSRDEFPASRVFNWRLNTNSKIQLEWWDAASGGATLRTLTSDTALIIGQKYHVAVVVTTTDVRIYVNGVLDCTPANSFGGVTAGSAKMGLGVTHAASAGAPSGPFNGTLDELAYFTTALSAADILALATNANTISTLASPPGGVQWTTWFRADDIALADGASVTSWPNRGVGPASAATPGTAPVYRTSGIGGQPAVEFNGTTQYLATNLPCSGTAESVFAVLQPTDYAGYRIILGATVSAGRHWRLNLTTGVQELDRQGTVARALSSSAVSAAAHYIGYTDTNPGGVVSFYKDGVSQGGGTSAGAYAAGSSRIGSDGGAFFKGKIAELMVINRVIDSTELAALATYFNGRYGI